MDGLDFLNIDLSGASLEDLDQWLDGLGIPRFDYSADKTRLLLTGKRLELLGTRYAAVRTAVEQASDAVDTAKRVFDGE